MHAASQPPQPSPARPQDALMQRLGMLELLLQHTAMAARAAATQAPGGQSAAGHQADDASSQCCGDSAPRGSKRALGGLAGDAGRASRKRARNIAYIELCVSTPAGVRKPDGLPQVTCALFTLGRCTLSQLKGMQSCCAAQKVLMDCDHCAAQSVLGRMQLLWPLARAALDTLTLNRAAGNLCCICGVN